MTVNLVSLGGTLLYIQADSKIIDMIENHVKDVNKENPRTTVPTMINGKMGLLQQIEIIIVGEEMMEVIYILCKGLDPDVWVSRIGEDDNNNNVAQNCESDSEEKCERFLSIEGLRNAIDEAINEGNNHFYVEKFGKHTVWYRNDNSIGNENVLFKYYAGDAKGDSCKGYVTKKHLSWWANNNRPIEDLKLSAVEPTREEDDTLNKIEDDPLWNTDNTWDEDAWYASPPWSNK